MVGDGLEALMSFKMTQWSCMLLNWRKCLLLDGERKFYGQVTKKASQHVMMKDYTN